MCGVCVRVRVWGVCESSCVGCVHICMCVCVQVGVRVCMSALVPVTKYECINMNA